MKITMVFDKPAIYRRTKKKGIFLSRDLAAVVPCGDLDREAFFVVLLDQKNFVLSIELISLGTLTASLVHPREVFGAALHGQAAAIAFVHNHPSGDTTPSNQDKQLTKTLCDGANLLGLRVLDHVIIGENGTYFSFRDDGLI